MRYRWLLFDADGTLFDFDTAEAKALRETFEQLDMIFSPDYAQTYHRVNAQVWAEFEKGQITQQALRTERFDRLFRACGVQPPVWDGLETFSRRYLENLARHGDLIDGAEEVIRRLAQTHQLAMITNGIASVQRSRFYNSPLAKYFSALIISEEVGAAKPEGKYFDATFERIGFPPKEEVLVIGDSLSSDMQGGLDYSLDTCWYNPKLLPLPPELYVRYQIQQLQDLFAIVTRGGADDESA